MVAESPEEKLSRLQQMVKDRGQTWDLSPNDKVAIKHVLGMVNWMAEALSYHWSETVERTIERVGDNVERIQNSQDAKKEASCVQDVE